MTKSQNGCMVSYISNEPHNQHGYVYIGIHDEEVWLTFAGKFESREINIYSDKRDVRARYFKGDYRGRGACA